MSKTIFLDLDGVVVDFVLPALKVHGVSLKSLAEYPMEAGWDVVKATNMLRDPLGLEPISATTFWNRFSLTFWRTLPMFPEAPAFVEELIDLVGVENICIATSATLDPQCAAGKVAWIEAQLPMFSRQYFIGPDKHFLARPDAILIDDRDKNCEKFQDAGGTSILVPRPWNLHRYNELPYDFIMRMLLHLI